MRALLLSLLKSLACGLLFFIGTVLGGMIAAAAGLPVPAMPAGADQAVLGGYLFLISLATGALLAYLAARLDGRFLARWLALAGMGWIVYSLSTYFEASIYTDYDAASLYKVVMDLAAFALSGAAAAALFPARPAFAAGGPRRSTPARSGLAWRLAAAWIAFPLIYLGFGKIVEPLVVDYYRQGLFELAAPGWSQILTAQSLRSLLFLAVCLGILRLWTRSRAALWAALAAALFLWTGGFYMLQAYWLPAGLRLVHTLEMLADSLVYAACLAALFGAQAAEPAGAPSGRLARPL